MGLCPHHNANSTFYNVITNLPVCQDVFGRFFYFYEIFFKKNKRLLQKFLLISYTVFYTSLLYSITILMHIVQYFNSNYFTSILPHKSFTLSDIYFNIIDEIIIAVNVNIQFKNL